VAALDGLVGILKTTIGLQVALVILAIGHLAFFRQMKRNREMIRAILARSKERKEEDA